MARLPNALIRVGLASGSLDSWHLAPRLVHGTATKHRPPHLAPSHLTTRRSRRIPSRDLGACHGARPEGAPAICLLIPRLTGPSPTMSRHTFRCPSRTTKTSSAPFTMTSVAVTPMCSRAPLRPSPVQAWIRAWTSHDMLEGRVHRTREGVIRYQGANDRLHRRMTNTESGHRVI